MTLREPTRITSAAGAVRRASAGPGASSAPHGTTDGSPAPGSREERSHAPLAKEGRALHSRAALLLAAAANTDVRTAEKFIRMGAQIEPGVLFRHRTRERLYLAIRSDLELAAEVRTEQTRMKSEQSQPAAPNAGRVGGEVQTQTQPAAPNAGTTRSGVAPPTQTQPAAVKAGKERGPIRARAVERTQPTTGVGPEDDDFDPDGDFDDDEDPDLGDDGDDNLDDPTPFDGFALLSTSPAREAALVADLLGPQTQPGANGSREAANTLANATRRDRSRDVMGTHPARRGAGR